MKNRPSHILLKGLILPCALALPLQAAMIVAPSSDATVLASSILGGGITLVGTPTYSGANSLASGTFSGGLSTGIGIANGLIMTTGLASSATGPNTSGSTSGGGSTSSLNFTFTTAGGDLFFNYVFASEEYNEFVNSLYNDSFGFYLDGANIALIPGTSTPVSINNVNLGLNSSYYNNNSPGPFDIEYDGFTTVFTASVIGLAPGNHNISLVVSDLGDSSYDSAVFIQGSSFSDTPTPPSVPDGGTTASLLGVALLGLFGLKRKV